MNVDLKDNSTEAKQQMIDAINRGLKTCGEVAVTYAKMALKDTRGTGNLANSITYAVEDASVYIGTNVHYAPYVEFGTGEYSEVGGRMTSWCYRDADGNWWRTTGQHPHPYLRPSASEHTSEYLAIIRNSMENA